MSKPVPRTLEVIRSAYVTPHMLRVTLGGSELAAFPEDQESAYIKLIFPQQGESRPLMRTYTVSGQRSDEIDVDFVLHAADGPASAWGRNAKPGDQILVGGPGPKKLINKDADWYLLVGDMTALPAIAVNLAQLPEDARGYAVLEVLTEADIQPLPHPENVEIHWVINATPDGDSSALLQRVEQLCWLPGQPAVWTACEFHSMRALRTYFKKQRQVLKSHLYISSYWKINSTEDQHKIAKKDDAQSA
ncbi:siderophore-interacting protein [Marinobacter sp. ANT_B65]|uniref:siderophore-interacting protein n=1 Tax=Marinobacter sp. ANT_B65 TaxID=2039467 RepID=UPI000BBF177B|nr:siderophore-interacting protein [Marinobacter sp. ANT_B65]PCM45994.1 NADPH-dependent ferric siderophore reductase [Marinobacter sp. ANT_B65]